MRTVQWSLSCYVRGPKYHLTSSLLEWNNKSEMCNLTTAWYASNAKQTWSSVLIVFRGYLFATKFWRNSWHCWNNKNAIILDAWENIKLKSIPHINKVAQVLDIAWKSGNTLRSEPIATRIWFLITFRFSISSLVSSGFSHTCEEITGSIAGFTVLIQSPWFLRNSCLQYKPR